MITMTDAEKIALVEEMLQAWEDLDFAKAAALFAEDGVLHSVAAEPCVGRAAITERFTGHQTNISEMTFLDRTIGVIDGRVFVERLDEFVMGGARVRVPVIGVFRAADGRITEWLEYMDHGTIRAAVEAGAGE